LKTKHLLDLPGANERLTLWKADLDDEGSFDAVVDGGKTALHARKVYRLKKSQLAYGQKQVYSERPKLCAQLVLLRALLK